MINLNGYKIKTHVQSKLEAKHITSIMRYAKSQLKGVQPFEGVYWEEELELKIDAEDENEALEAADNTVYNKLSARAESNDSYLVPERKVAFL